MSARSPVRVRRVYEEPDPADGVRILVDRLWPRGIRKQELPHDAWLKDVAPSRELRTWYGHRPERFERFALRYHKELLSSGPADALEQLRRKASSHTLTLLTATRDVERSGAAVLAETLRKMGPAGRRGAR